MFLNQNIPFFKIVMTIVLVILHSAFSYSQNNDSVVAKDTTKVSNLINQNDSAVSNAPKLPVNITFNNKQINLIKGEAVSNVMKIENNSGKDISFTIEMQYPAGWKNLTKTSQTYSIKNGEHLFLPVRLLPANLSIGNFKFVINVFLIDDDMNQLSFGYFYAGSEKKGSWDMKVNPGSKIYLKNGIDVTDFSVSINNTGTESQNILLSLSLLKNNNALLDSNDNIIKQPFYTFKLKENRDTTFTFRFKFKNAGRNQKRVDIDGYTPVTSGTEQQQTLFINTLEPKLEQKNVFKKGQKIEFAKLANAKKITPYGNNSLPLIVDLNAMNLLGVSTIASLNLNGSMNISKNEFIVYSAQTNYTNHYLDNFFDQNAYYAGYFFEKGNVQIGNINGDVIGIPSFGRGIKGQYIIDENNKAGAFFTRNPGLFRSSRFDSYGVNYETRYYKKNRLQIGLARSDNHITNGNFNALNARTGFSYKNHNISVGIAGIQNNSNTPGNNTTYGIVSSNSYSGLYLNGKLNTNQTFIYNSNDYISSVYRYIFYGNRTRYTLTNKWMLTLLNNINNVKSGTVNVNTSYFNQLTGSYKSENGLIQPLVYYHIFQIPIIKYHSRGLGVLFNRYDIKNETRTSVLIKAGYNKPIILIGKNDYFNLQSSLILQYKVISLNARYFYGANSPAEQALILLNNKNPQSFFSGFQHQYQFKNIHWIFQNNINYSYQNILKNHNVNTSPELYYYTNDGWRFKLNANINLISSGSKNTIYNQQQVIIPENDEPIVTTSYFFGIGVRKEFGIPIPFIKKTTFNIYYKAFLDLNGNGLFDKGEQTLENIIIKYENDEVITNEKGNAEMLNVNGGWIHLKVFSVAKLDGWFCSIPDSIEVLTDREVYIPYTRGVKVKGKVVLDRDKLSADANKPFDLSRIKISANNGKYYQTLTDFDGNFEFYLPNGVYTFTLDENVLGDTYTLAQNNIKIDLTKDADGIYVSFFIIEKKKKVNKKKFGN